MSTRKEKQLNFINKFLNRDIIENHTSGSVISNIDKMDMTKVDNLLSKLPPVFVPLFSESVQNVLDLPDSDRSKKNRKIGWYTMLFALYQGKIEYINMVFSNWEDEVDFYNGCEKFKKIISV